MANISLNFSDLLNFNLTKELEFTYSNSESESIISITKKLDDSSILKNFWNQLQNIGLNNLKIIECSTEGITFLTKNIINISYNILTDASMGTRFNTNLLENITIKVAE